MARPLSEHEELVLGRQLADAQQELATIERQIRVVREALCKKRREQEGSGASDCEDESLTVVARAKAAKVRLESHVACLNDHVRRLGQLLCGGG